MTRKPKKYAFSFTQRLFPSELHFDTHLKLYQPRWFESIVQWQFHETVGFPRIQGSLVCLQTSRKSQFDCCISGM